MDGDHPGVIQAREDLRLGEETPRGGIVAQPFAQLPIATIRFRLMSSASTTTAMPPSPSMAPRR